MLDGILILQRFDLFFIVIYLAGNRMSGEIPSELGNLISLSNLDIRKCVECYITKATYCIRNYENTLTLSFIFVRWLLKYNSGRK